MAVEFRVLGPLELLRDGQPIAVSSAKQRLMLAVLLSHANDVVSVDALVGGLWSSGAPSTALGVVRSYVSHLRKVLETPASTSAKPQVLVGMDGGYRLVVQSELFDAAQFERLHRAGRAAMDEGRYADAIGLLNGGLALWRGRAFGDLAHEAAMQPAAQRLQELHTLTFEHRTDAAMALGGHREIIGELEAALSEYPLREGLWAQLMVCLYRSGRQAEALGAYQRLRRHLGEELGLEPSVELRRLESDILQQGPQLDWVAPSPARGAASPDVGTNSAVTKPPLSESLNRRDNVTGPFGTVATLVGRDREWDQLVKCWQTSAQGHAQLVLVRGEAGIGKSRLVEDFRAWCARIGVSTASARAYEAEGSLSYAPIIDLLRSQVVRPALARLDTVWLSEIARLLPELLVGQRDLPPPGPLGANERTRLFEAMARAIASAGVSRALVVDDLQWCDADTLQFLHFLLRFSPGAPLLVLATARDEDVGPDHPLHAMVAGLRAMDALVEVPLGRLDQAAARALAEELVGEDEETIRRVVESSEGNPLFLVEIARSGLAAAETEAGAGPAALLPVRVQSVIEARLARLPHSAGELADAASVVGRAFSVEVVSRLLHERGEGDAVAAIDELWRRGILQERGVDAYDFSHDKIREVAYARIPPARRHRLHAELAAVLEDLHADALDAVAGQIAVHHDRAGASERAVQFYQRAVEVAHRVHAHDDVIALSGRALELLAQQPGSPERDDRELALLGPLGVAHYAGRSPASPEVRRVHERATALRAGRGLPADPSSLRLLANYAISRRDYVQAHRQGEALLAQAEGSGGDPVLLTEAHYVLGVSNFWLGSFESSRRHLQRSLAEYRPELAVTHIARFGQDPRPICLVRLAWTSWHLGHFEEAQQLRNLALEHAGDHHQLHTDAYVRLFAAWLAFDAGDGEAMTALVGGLGETAQHSLWVAAYTKIFRGWDEVMQGDIPAGTRTIENAIDEACRAQYAMCEPLGLLLLARAYARGGALDAAVQVAATVAVIAEREMPFHEADAFRLYGDLLAMSGGEHSAIERALRHAVDTAARQGAVVLEVRARTSLARWLRHKRPVEGQAEERRLDTLRRRLPGVTLADFV